MAQQQFDIATRDGTCPTLVVVPDGQGAGPWPAVILYMDAFAIRPALIGVAQRLADAGYLVLLPDLFFRHPPHAVLDPAAILAAGAFREVCGPLMASTDALKAVADTEALLAFLDTRSDVAGRLVGTVGFCMGGGMALAAAGAFPDRVAAAASFHGGNLATDAPASPHRLAPRIAGEVYVAGADKDASYPPDMAARLERTLADAAVRHRLEIYPGAGHGWMLPDLPVHDEAAAARGWRELLALFDRALPATAVPA